MFFIQTLFEQTDIPISEECSTIVDELLPQFSLGCVTGGLYNLRTFNNPHKQVGRYIGEGRRFEEKLRSVRKEKDRVSDSELKSNRACEFIVFKLNPLLSCIPSVSVMYIFIISSPQT